MKIRHVCLIALFAATGLASHASIDTSTTASGTPRAQSVATTYVSISDRRWIVIDGTPYFLTATGGTFYVTQSYYNSGDLNSIPFDEFYYDANQGYAFESVGSVGVDTGTHISGGPASFTISATYSLYLDNQANIKYGQYGCLALLPSVGNSLYEQWDRWVTVGIVSCNGYYLCAEGGGGGPVYANRPGQAVWETFQVCSSGSNVLDRVAGKLNSGDTISVLSAGPYWVCAEAGSHVYLDANRTSAWAWEHFTIAKTSGSGRINDGDSISIQSQYSNLYWCAENGGGPYYGGDKGTVIVNVNRMYVGSWETFTLRIQ